MDEETGNCNISLCYIVTTRTRFQGSQLPFSCSFCHTMALLITYFQIFGIPMSNIKGNCCEYICFIVLALHSFNMFWFDLNFTSIVFKITMFQTPQYAPHYIWDNYFHSNHITMKLLWVYDRSYFENLMVVFLFKRKIKLWEAVLACIILS